jgi:hypothetical protein
MKIVSADGKETTTQATYESNGKDYPSMGNLDFDSLSGPRECPPSVVIADSG